MPAFELIIQPTIIFQLCTLFENLYSKTTSCLVLFFFLNQYYRNYYLRRRPLKMWCVQIVLAPDYKGNLTTVNSLWKSFLIQPTEHQVHQVQNIRIKGDLTSLLVWVFLTLSLLNEYTSNKSWRLYLIHLHICTDYFLLLVDTPDISNISINTNWDYQV